MHPSVRHLFRLADFRRLWCLGLLLGCVRWLEVLAVGLFTLAATDSPFVVALMLFARTFPSVLFGAVTGAVATQFGRRRLLTVGLALLCVNAAVLTVLAWCEALELWHVAVGAVLSGVVWTLEHPVRRTLLGDVAGAPHVPNAISLDTFSFNSTRMIGPLTGGAVYAILGMPGVYTVSLCLVSICLWLCVTTGAPGAPKITRDESFLENVRGGFAYARKDAVVRGILLVTVLTNVFGFSYATMVPVIARKIHGLSSTETGVLQSVEGVGAMMTALLLALTTKTFSHVRLFSGSALAFLAFMLVFAVSPFVGLAAAALLVAGAGIAGFGAMQSTVLLDQSEPDQRERVMGLLVVCIGAQPFGVLLVGALAEAFGPVVGLATMAVIGLSLTALLVVTQPALRNRAGAVRRRP